MINKIRLDFQKYNANALLTGIAIKISGPVGMRIIQFLRGELIACALAGAQKLEMSKELLAVDSNMIVQALDEIAKLILRLEEHPKKTRKEKNTRRKIQGFGSTHTILKFDGSTVSTFQINVFIKLSNSNTLIFYSFFLSTYTTRRNLSNKVLYHIFFKYLAQVITL